MHRAGELWLKSVFGDGGENLRRLLANDATDSVIRHIVAMIYLPKPIKRVLAAVAGLFGDYVS